MRDFQVNRNAQCQVPTNGGAKTAINHEHNRARSELAFSYLNYGEMYFGVAERADSAQEKQDNLTHARSWYQKSLDVWQDMQRNGGLHPLDTQYPDQAAQKVHRCDEALARISSH